MIIVPDLARSFEALKSSLRLISFFLSSPSVLTRAGLEYPRDWILPHLPCFFLSLEKIDTYPLEIVYLQINLRNAHVSRSQNL